MLGNSLTGSVPRLRRIGPAACATTLAWGIAFALVGAAPSAGVAAGVIVVVGVLRGGRGAG